MKSLLASLVLLLATIVAGHSATVVLAWDPNPEPDIAGYIIYTRVMGGSYTPTVTVTNGTTASITNLALGRTYFFVATAYNTSGLESDYSNEVSCYLPDKPSPPQNLRTNQVILKTSLLRSQRLDGEWAVVHTFSEYVTTNNLDQAFFKTKLAIELTP